MRWTKEKPSKPGWYWWRARRKSKPFIFYLSRGHIRNHEVFTMGSPMRVLFLSELPGEMAGPLDPPEEEA